MRSTRCSSNCAVDGKSRFDVENELSVQVRSSGLSQATQPGHKEPVKGDKWIFVYLKI